MIDQHHAGRDIDVVGVGVRLPGGIGSLDGLWTALIDGVDIVGLAQGPRARGWPGALGHGALFPDVDRFDAGYFGIAPQEADDLDPAQRLLLETTGQALEDAALRPDDLRGTRTGVFTGSLSNDYLVAQARQDFRVGPYYSSGNEFSFGAGRMAHRLDLHGPVMNVTTACSAGLVALDQAVSALRRGACDVAIVAAANVILDPHHTEFMATVGAISPTRTCKPFSARADGIVRSEAAVSIVLARGGAPWPVPPRATVRGSAVGHNGKTPGLTMPSVAGQERVILAALDDSGIRPDEVDYVEAHGTGTPLGDPVEATALARAIAGHRRRVLPIGSIKGNLGHTDAVSGLMGLVKAVLILERECIPPSLHSGDLSEMIDWQSLNVTVPQHPVPLGTSGRPAVVGVSSFGLSGTNCHVVMQQALPAPAPSMPETDLDRAVLLSAHSEEALATYATRLADSLEGLDEAGAWALNRDLRRRRETPDTYRKGVSLEVVDDAVKELRSFAGPAAGPSRLKAREPWFVFSGQGSHRPGMGRALRDSTHYLHTIEELDRLFGQRGLPGVREYLLDDGTDPSGHATVLVQPAVLTLQLAQAAFLQGAGVRPAATVGHSMGEYAAAVVAGVLPLDEAVRLVALRAQSADRHAGNGRMIVVRAEQSQVSELMSGLRAWPSVRNSMDDWVWSVGTDDVAAAATRLRDAGISHAVLPGDHGFHSPLMEDAGAEFRDAVGEVRRHDERIPVATSVRGASRLDGTADHWVRNLIEPVDFHAALGNLPDATKGLAVEFGPGNDLQPYLRKAGLSSFSVSGGPRRPRTDRGGILAACFEAGLNLAEPGRAQPGPRLPLPDYPFDRRSHWYDGGERAVETSGEGDGEKVTALHVGRGDEAGVRLDPSPSLPAPPQAAQAGDGNPGGRGAEELAEVLTEEMSRILGAGPLDPHVGFMEQGLTSVDGVAVVSNLRRRGVELEVNDLYDFPTPATLLEALSARSSAGGQDRPAGHTGAAAAPATAPTVTRRAGSETEPEPATHDIHVTGMACRFPGVDSPRAYWDLLMAGGSAFGSPPVGRFTSGENWPGCYLDDPYGFDEKHFRLSRSEAEGIDPQHRMLMMLAVEALEDGGVDPDGIDDRIGVFIGADSHDYSDMAVRAEPTAGVHYGNMASIAGASGRISYHLGLTGPSMTVDTACSSSLVALHSALSALRRGECEYALVGGVNLILAETIHQSTQLAGALSPTGVCRPFSRDADGYVRGEGAGMVLLSRQPTATTHPERSYAMVLGSAVGHDGRSSGYTAPNGTEQTALMRRAWEDAGVGPSDVAVIEAHGTGTPLGDPIEVAAISRAMPDLSRPCLLGSVKSNIGHLESASGIAGFIKAALGAWHGVVPATLSAEDASTEVDWSTAPLELVRRPTRVQPGAVFGVSSFGFTGTNAHVVLRGATTAPEPWAPAPGVHAVPLSGPDEASVDSATEAVRTLTAAEPSIVPELSWWQRRRGHGRRRAVLTYRPDGHGSPTLAGRQSGPAAPNGRLGLVFSGHGSQWQGMGAALHATSEAFAAVVAELDAYLPASCPHTITSLFTDRCADHDDEQSQLAIFGLQVGLFELLSPSLPRDFAVLGHSMGESAALYAAGTLSLKAATQIAWARIESLKALEGRGGMTATGLSPDQCEEILGDFPDLDLAVVNCHRMSVVSGPLEELERLERTLRSRRTFARRLPAGGPGHGRLAAVAARDIVTRLHDVERDGTTIPLRPYYSPVTGGLTDPDARDGNEYWRRNLGEPVRFDLSSRAALADGYDVFLEISPSAILESPLRQTINREDLDARVLHVMDETGSDHTVVSTALGSLWCAGADVVLPGSLTGPSRRSVLVPPRPWDISQRKRSFVGVAVDRGAARGSGAVTVSRSDEDPPTGSTAESIGALVASAVEAVAGHFPDARTVAMVEAEAWAEGGTDGAPAVVRVQASTPVDGCRVDAMLPSAGGMLRAHGRQEQAPASPGMGNQTTTVALGRHRTRKDLVRQVVTESVELLGLRDGESVVLSSLSVSRDAAVAASVAVAETKAEHRSVAASVLAADGSTVLQLSLSVTERELDTKGWTETVGATWTQSAQDGTAASPSEVEAGIHAFVVTAEPVVDVAGVTWRSIDELAGGEPAVGDARAVVVVADGVSVQDIGHVLDHAHQAAAGVGARVWTVTRGGTDGPSGRDRVVPAQVSARRAAIGRGVSSPVTWGGVVDLSLTEPGSASMRDALLVVAAQSSGGQYDRVAVRGGQCWTERIGPAYSPPSADAIKANTKNRRFVIMPQCAMADQTRRLLEAAGVEPDRISPELGEGPQTLIWLGSARRMWSRGSTSNDELDPGAEYHRFTETVDRMGHDGQTILVSALTSWWGGIGDPESALLDGLLEAHIHALRREGRSATTLWTGAFSDQPDQDFTTEVLGRLSAAGIRPMGMAETAAAWRPTLIDARLRPHAVVDCDWRVVSAIYGAAVHWPFFGILAGAATAAPRQWATYDEAERHVERAVLRILSEVTGHEVLRRQRSKGFFEMGITSISGLELVARLEAEFGVSLPSTTVFDHSTPLALTSHLLGTMDGVPPLEKTDVAEAADVAGQQDDAGDLDGQIDELEGLLAELEREGAAEPRRRES